MKINKATYDELTILIEGLIADSGLGIEKYDDETNSIGHYLGIFQYKNIRTEVLGWGDGDVTHKVFFNGRLVFDFCSFFEEIGCDVDESGDIIMEGYFHYMGDYEPGQWEKELKQLYKKYLCDAVSNDNQKDFSFVSISVNSKPQQQIDLAEVYSEFYF